MSVKSKGLTVPDKSAADGANRGIRKYIRHNWQLWIMLFPAMLYILIFCYVPMYGIQLAFREYSFTAGITGGKFVGMKYFIPTNLPPVMPAVKLYSRNASWMPYMGT